MRIKIISYAFNNYISVKIVLIFMHLSTAVSYCEWSVMLQTKLALIINFTHSYVRTSSHFLIFHLLLSANGQKTINRAAFI